jgi:hypothetical protein
LPVRPSGVLMAMPPPYPAGDGRNRPTAYVGSSGSAGCAAR